LSEKAQVSENLRRIINNGFYIQHPFALSSAQLGDMISIFAEMRRLPAEDLALCVKAIDALVHSKEDCVGCYGKGLSYLKWLTKGLDEDAHRAFTKKYNAFASQADRDFDQELEARMSQYR